MMRAKRQRDRKAIASFQQGRQERQEGPADPVPQEELPQQEEEEEDVAETVQVRAAGAAGAGGHTARSQKPMGQAVVQPHLPILSVEVGHRLSLQSVKGLWRQEAGRQPQVQGQPKLQSGAVSLG